MPQNTLYSVQALRAIAASLVVIFHTFVYLEARGLIPAIPEFVSAGRSGVDIFFVISGFIMTYISSGKFGTRGAPKDFLIKRVIRIVPIYWLYTLVMAILLFALPHLFSDSKAFDLPHAIASFAFIPWENNLGFVKPVLQVGWTLNFEMYFYLLVTLLLFFSKKYFLPSLSIILLSGLMTSFLFPSNVPPVLYVITSPLLIEFLMGCIIGTFYRSRPTLPIQASIAIIIIGSSTLLLTGIVDSTEIPRVIKWGIPSALLVTGFIFLEANSRITICPILVNLGNSSYSLYLIHIFVINAIGKIWTMSFGTMYEFYIPFAILSSLVAGHIAYVLIEKPITTHLNSVYRNYKRTISL